MTGVGIAYAVIGSAGFVAGMCLRWPSPLLRGLVLAVSPVAIFAGSALVTWGLAA